jgi:murein DD-endopeptidase MepM/ murein hydrolase activator NlpD
MPTHDNLRSLCLRWQDAAPATELAPEALEDPAVLDCLPEALRIALMSRYGVVHPALALYGLRHQLGLSPCPMEARFQRWADRNQSPVALLTSLAHKTHEVIEFASEQRFALGGHTDPEYNTRLLFDAMGDSRVALGRYLEDRAFYREPQFFRGDEARSVHLGVDVFDHAEASVYAPFDGKVHSLAYNAKRLDYGATIILEHTMEDDTPFFTLYGHLSRQSLKGLSQGDHVAQGDAFCRLGPPSENGGWVPHLHFQVILDMLNFEGDYPGAAFPSEIAIWRSLCPDPRRIVAIAT